MTVFNKKELIYNKKYYLVKKDVEIYLSPFLELNANEVNIHKKHFFTNMFGNVNTYKELNEISPEFFYLPEIFNDLELPEKYQNNKYKLIECFRNELEYSDTSIISWINLIFGVQQLNPNNKNSIDTFPQYITHNSQIKNKIFHRILSNYPNESGKAPLKLFNEILLDKFHRLFSFTYLLNKIQVEQTKTLFQMNLCIDQKRIDPKEKDFPILISQNLDDMNYINIVLQSFSYTKLYIEISHKGEVKLVLKNMIKFKKPFNTINPFLSKENVLFINNNYVCVYGFYDSHIEIRSYNNLKNQTIINTPYDTTSVTKLCYDKRNQKIYCGYGSGNIIVYHMINECHWKVQKYINDHNGAITDIAYHNGLQVAVTSSKRDKFVNVYTVPSFNLIRKILVIPNIQSNAYISHVFVSNSPVNSISVYLEEENTLKAFTLNGRELQIDDNSNDKFKYSSHCILQSINGIDDFIAFGTENGYFVLRKFPDMQKLYEIQVFENIKIEYLLLFTKHNIVVIIGENLNYIAFIENVEAQKINVKKRIGAFIYNFA